MEDKVDVEKEYNSLVENGADVVDVRGKKFNIHWMRAGTQRKVSSIITKYGDDDTVQYRCAAAFILNSFWSILFFHWIYWRYMFYIKEYTFDELAPVIEMSKKKIQLKESLRNMASLIGVMDTLSNQTITSVRSFLQGLASEQSTGLKEA